MKKIKMVNDHHQRSYINDKCMVQILILINYLKGILIS